MAITTDTVLTRAKYLTPIRFKKELVFGAAYDEAFKLCSDSQRYSERTIFKHGDPAVLPPEALRWFKRKTISGDILYLGHSFNLYGHFLLETLPMIDYVMDDEFSGCKFLFLPWFRQKQRILLDTLRLLGIDLKESKIVIHDGSTTLIGSFFIVPRPIEINHQLINAEPYRSVIDKLKTCPAVKAYRNKTKVNNKIFLQIDAKRTTPEYASMVENIFSRLGFSLVRPEKLTLAEQIGLISEAEYIAGFSGSALHNAIFAEAGAKVIQLDYNRSPLSAIRNQEIITEITGVEHAYIPYQEANLEAIAASLIP